MPSKKRPPESLREKRWRQARLNLARAVEPTGLKARIHGNGNDRKDECTVTLQKDELTFSAEHVDIATVEDQPSPALDTLVERAKLSLLRV
jgi:hypothetical protein